MEGELQDAQGKFLEAVCRDMTFIEKQVTNMREPVEVERQVAATLYYLSDEGRLRKTANAFGLSRSSVSIIIRRVTHAITVHLGPNYITVPLTEDAVKDNVTNFLLLFPSLNAWVLLMEPILKLSNHQSTPPTT